MPRKTVSKKTASKKRKESIWLYLTILLAGLWIGTLLYSFNTTFRYNIKTLAHWVGISVAEEYPDVFERGGRTYVAFNHPLIRVTALTTADCEGAICNLPQAVLEIKQAVSPGLIVEEVKYESAEGQQLAADLGIEKLPAFIFDANLAELPHFELLAGFFEQKGEVYLLKVGDPGKIAGAEAVEGAAATEPALGTGAAAENESAN